MTSLSKRAQRFYRSHLLTPASALLLDWSGTPIVAVTGTNGKTTTTRLIEEILRAAGYRVGMCCSDGVMRNGEWILKGDRADPSGVRRAVRGGQIDVLVAETARGGIIRSGFGFRTCTVAVVTNVSEGHLGFDGIETLDQMAEVKSRLVQRVSKRGTAVLNADDPRVAAMSECSRGSVIYFSMREPPESVQDCLYTRSGAIWRRDAGHDIELMSIGDLAISYSGFLSHNVANAMAVLGAMQGLRSRMPVDDALVKKFFKAESKLPIERSLFHLFENKGRHILVLNSKNPAGYAADMPVLRRLRALMEYERVVGIITHVGNRLPAVHREMAADAAHACDFVMAVRPNKESLRGVPKETIVKALEAGIPVEKLLRTVDGTCQEVISHLQPQFPKRTLYVLLNSHHHDGLHELLANGTTLGAEMGAKAWREPHSGHNGLL